MDKPCLESEVKASRFLLVVDQFKQWRAEKRFGEDYFANCVKIIFGYPPTDYRVISHGNRVVNSFISGIDDLTDDRISPDNKLVNSRIYNPVAKRYE